MTTYCVDRSTDAGNFLVKTWLQYIWQTWECSIPESRDNWPQSILEGIASLVPVLHPGTFLVVEIHAGDDVDPKGGSNGWHEGTEQGGGTAKSSAWAHGVGCNHCGRE